MDSTYVYQGLLQGVKKEIIDSYSLPIIKDRLPDLTFVFTLKAELVVERLKKSRRNTEDRLDNFSLESHKKICSGYKSLIDEKPSYPNGLIPKRFEIDASLNKNEMTDCILKIIAEEGIIK
jgi:thymidylate kinase